MEWVLPTHLREKWSLKRFAEVFDALDDESTTGNAGEERPWTRNKRVVLATLQDDSTVVYYVCIVLYLLHHGIKLSCLSRSCMMGL
jgi:tRNA-splicing endonuclease subunit Sen15